MNTLTNELNNVSGPVHGKAPVGGEDGFGPQAKEPTFL